MTPAPRRIGRFAIVRLLGRGAQGEVFLADDTRLGRQVAVKTLSLSGTHPLEHAALVHDLLAEARMVAALQHPNLVTLHDAGEERGVPYLVFEYVAGSTLAELLRVQGRLTPARAVCITLDSLKGLAYAHAQRVVHRDLKPGNIMLTHAGIPRVTDFGIAVRGAAAVAGTAPVAGTPAYLAPEALAGEGYLPVSDLYALGCVLYEMLTGAPPARGASVEETLTLVARGAFEPPSRLNPEVDAALDALVLKALAADPSARYPDADAMAEALARYLAPAPGATPPPSARGTLEFLLRRMRHTNDFPVLLETIAAINRLAADEREPASTMCNAILKDVSLTGKLLRLVNAAHYGEFCGSVSTVSRAISILGFDAVRNVATSLALFEHLRNRAQADTLKEELVASYFSALLARELAPRLGARNGEEAFICAMFQRLGRLLVRFYLHEEHQAIQRLAHKRNWAEPRAARDILGMSYHELGMGVARSWNFPLRIVESMRPLSAAVTSRAAFEDDQLRVLAALSNELCEAARSEAAEERTVQVRALEKKYGKGTGASERILAAAMQASLEQLANEAPSLGLQLAGAALFRRAWQSPAQADHACARLIDPTTVLEPQAAPLSATQAAAPPGQRQAVLAAGVQEITEALLGKYELNDVLRIVLETVYRGIGFRCVLLCVREAGREVLKARFGFGDVDSMVEAGFTLPLEAARDGTDVIVAELGGAARPAQLPAWIREVTSAQNLLILPIRVNSRPVGAIYAEAADPGLLQLRPEELNLLKTLRNQATLAIKQRG